MVLDAIQIVLSIFAMIALGMYLAHIGWLDDKGRTLLSQLVVRVALPAMVVSKLFTSFSRDMLLSSALGIALPLASLLGTMAVGLLIGAKARIPRERRGAFLCMFTFSNSVYIGVPVSVALFGGEVVPYTLLYYIANTFVFWTLGASAMRRDASAPAAKGDWRLVPGYLGAAVAHFFTRRDAAPSPSKDARYQRARAALAPVTRAFPLPLVTFLVCVALILLGVRLPRFLLDAAGYVGSLVTPLSLLFVGAVLLRLFQRGFHWQKGYGWILAGRFLVSPALLIALQFVMPSLPVLMRNALIVQAAMPVMTNISIVARAIGGDEEYAAGGIALTTLLSLVTIPLTMVLLPHIP